MVKVGGSNLPTDDVVPSYVYVQGLDIRAARPPYGFTDDAGAAQARTRDNAAAVHVEIGAHVVVQTECLLHDAGNGLFAGAQSKRPMVRSSANFVFENGIERQHLPPQQLHGVPRHHLRVQPVRAAARGGAGQQLEGPLQRHGDPLQLDRERQPPARPGRDRTTTTIRRRPRLRGQPSSTATS